MENTNQHPGKNEDANTNNPLPSESESKRRSVDENGQRISWNNPEISESDNTEGRKPEIANQSESPDQPGNQSDKKEIPDDPNIRNLYDKDPSAATIHSSNADKTFGNENRNEMQNESQNFQRDQDSNSLDKDKKYSNPNEEDDSENEQIEGDNES